MKNRGTGERFAEASMVGLVLFPYSIIIPFVIPALFGAIVGFLFDEFDLLRLYDGMYLYNMKILVWIREHVVGIPFTVFIIGTIVSLIAGYVFWDYFTDTLGALLFASFVYLFYPSKTVALLIVISAVIFASASRDLDRVQWLIFEGSMSINHMYKFAIGFYFSSYVFYHYYESNLMDTHPTRFLIIWAIIFGLVFTFLQSFPYLLNLLSKTDKNTDSVPVYKLLIGCLPFLFDYSFSFLLLSDIIRFICLLVSGIMIWRMVGIADDRSTKAGLILSIIIIAMYLIYILFKVASDKDNIE